MRVAVVAEYYPRPANPGWGIWAHRQALAVRDLGYDVRVLALERPLPSLHALRRFHLREWLTDVRRTPRRTELDGIPVRYVRFVSPPRPTSYESWGRWAAGPLGRALDDLREQWEFDLVHAHYAVPAGDAVLRWMRPEHKDIPLVVSVHGGDLSYVVPRSEQGRERVRDVLGSAKAVLANSRLTMRGIEQVTGPLDDLRIVHPGADIPPLNTNRDGEPTLVTLAHLEEHKNQQGVIRALAALAERHPDLRYVMIGKGPDRTMLERLAESLGVADRVSFAGAMPHEKALAELARCHVHVMPSLHDAFGVAHIEAMAAGLPTIGGDGTGAEDIASAGDGMLLVAPGDVSALARTIDRLVSDTAERQRLGEAARETVRTSFSWQRCGALTAEVYRSLAAPRG